MEIVRKSGKKKVAWERKEDNRLTSLVESFGERNWDEIARHLGKDRNSSQCRERFVNYLRPDLTFHDFSNQEKSQFLALHAIFGNKWTQISAQLRGRSHPYVKNYYYLLLRKIIN